MSLPGYVLILYLLAKFVHAHLVSVIVYTLAASSVGFTRDFPRPARRCRAPAGPRRDPNPPWRRQAPFPPAQRRPPFFWWQARTSADASVIRGCTAPPRKPRFCDTRAAILVLYSPFNHVIAIERSCSVIPIIIEARKNNRHATSGQINSDEMARW